MFTSIIDLVFERVLTWECGLLSFTSMSSTEDDVAGMDGSCGTVSSVERHRPDPSFVVVLGGYDSRAQPDVELHDAGICFEPIAEFVFWHEHRPVRRKWQAGHVTVVHWVVCDESLLDISQMQCL